ncbi:MAG: antiviral reverse transcriptase Drt3b [candidate division FCPU426 bacterium]
MKHKKKKISMKKERVILSDVLPYEIPISFSNRRFREFINRNKICLAENKLKWGNSEPSFGSVIKLLFGFPKNMPIVNQSISLKCAKDYTTIPFNYRISHNENDFRQLTIIHPKNQLAVIEHYDKYKEMILYYCNISPFSIRRPYKTAKHIYYKDKTHLELLAHDHEHKSMEEYDKEYESLKTYFTYKEFSNVYKFYESYKYHECEKKYNEMMKFDILKCFDSIYSHSISWAILNKEIVKEKTEESKATFGGKFDTMMQNMNYGETNGIVIGPEFSRIFAEIIMQKIDLNVLRGLEKNRIYYKNDYEIYRYVDDYFVYFNDEKTKTEIVKEYRRQLKEYNLYINDSKTMLFKKPIITKITIAKSNISDLLNKYMKYKVSAELKDNIDTDAADDTDEGDKKYSIYISSNKLITKFKIIIYNAGIEYKDVLNYTLAGIDRRILKLIKIYCGIEDKRAQEKKVTKAILELLEFVFFIYSVSPRVNTTIKLCMIISKVIKAAKIKGNFNNENKNVIFKKIYDNIFIIINKNKNTEYYQIETLYLLTALKELGRDYRLEEEVLGKCFNIDLEEKQVKYKLNYFSITVLLFYIENKPRYNMLKCILQQYICETISEVPQEKRIKKAELTLLLFDLLSCPFFTKDFKRKILSIYDISDKNEQDEIFINSNFSFTNWSDFDFGKELEAKKSQEVY